VPAYCASQISSLVGNLEVVVQAVIGAEDTCLEKGSQRYLEQQQKDIEKKKEETEREVRQWLIDRGHNISQLPAGPLDKDKTYLDISRCVADIDLGSTFVMKAALSITDSTLHCHEQVIAGHGAHKVDPYHAQMTCAVDMVSLLGTLSLAIRFFSLAANSCINIVGDKDMNAQCVANCAGVSGGVFSATAGAMSLPHCQELLQDWDWNPDSWPKNHADDSRYSLRPTEELPLPAVY